MLIGGITAIGALATLGQVSRSFGAPATIGFAGLIPGFAIMFLGFIGLVWTQMGRASIDSAEYAQQSLQLAREQLEISKQGLKQGQMLEQGYAALQAAKETLTSGSASGAASYAGTTSGTESTETSSDHRHTGSTIDYRSKIIHVVDGGYLFGGTVFETLEDAKARVDEDGFALPPDPERPMPFADQLGVNETAEREKLRQVEANGRTLAQYSDGTYTIDDQRFANLDDAKEYLRLKAVKQGGTRR